MTWIFPIALLITFELIADVLSKKWSLGSGWLFAAGALSAYLVANVFWLFALKNGSGLARGATIFSVSSAIVAVALGVFLFHEKVSSAQAVGMVLGIVAIALIFAGE